MCFFLMHRSYFRVFFGSHKFRVASPPLPSRSKSFKRVVEWHDQLVSSKSLNITKIYQLIDELTWLHGKNNVL
jgi:hypothetical protein